MWRAMMLCDVIGEKASFVARCRDFQSIAVLLAQAPASVIQMIKNAETSGWMTTALNIHILFSVSPTAGHVEVCCVDQRSVPPWTKVSVHTGFVGAQVRLGAIVALA